MGRAGPTGVSPRTSAGNAGTQTLALFSWIWSWKDAIGSLSSRIRPENWPPWGRRAELGRKTPGWSQLVWEWQCLVCFSPLSVQILPDLSFLPPSLSCCSVAQCLDSSCSLSLCVSSACLCLPLYLPFFFYPLSSKKIKTKKQKHTHNTKLITLTIFKYTV